MSKRVVSALLARQGVSKIFPDQTITYTYSELSKEIKYAYGEVLGHSVGDNADCKIIQFLRNKRMIVQDENRKVSTLQTL